MSKLAKIIETPVYGGRAIINFYPLNHRYKVDIPERNIKLWQPSVTGILKALGGSKVDALNKWAVNTALDEVLGSVEAAGGDTVSLVLLRKVIDAARDAHIRSRDGSGNRGTLIHSYLEQYTLRLSGINARLLTEPPDFNKEESSWVRSITGWFDGHTITDAVAEVPVWSARFGYLGTPDLICKVDGVPSIIDYKPKIRPTVFLQMAAYIEAEHEGKGEEYIQQRIAFGYKTGGVQIKNNSTQKSDFTTFRALINAWNWDRTNDPYDPKQPPTIIGAF